MTVMHDAILAVNAGSSSLKFALYPQNGTDIGAAPLSGNIEGLEPGGSPLVRKNIPRNFLKTGKPS